MPKDLRKAIIRSTHSDKALKDAEDILFQDPLSKALVATTQAIDLVGGGVKTYVFSQVVHELFIDP